MTSEDRNAAAKASLDEQRLALDERRLELDRSFARKWLPTLATVMVGLVATVFGYVQQQLAAASTERARIESKSKDEREWGFKVVEMYFSKRELFDLTKNAEQATANLRVLAAVAPTAVQGLLDAEQARIPAPTGGEDEAQRLRSLSAVADIQNALAVANPASSAAVSALKPEDFLAYVQYAEGSKEIALKAQATLQKLGFRAPGVEQVAKVPSRLQVRYYRSEQHAFASKLAVDLGAALKLTATGDGAVRVVSTKQLPTGVVEVWLPLAAPTP